MAAFGTPFLIIKKVPPRSVTGALSLGRFDVGQADGVDADAMCGQICGWGFGKGDAGHTADRGRY